MLSKALELILIIAGSAVIIAFLAGMIRGSLQLLNTPSELSFASDKIHLKIFLSSIVIAALILVGGGAFAYYRHKTTPLGFNSAGYKDVNNSVGCNTTKSTDAAEEDWEKYYRGNLMVWTGLIEKVSNDSMMLDIDGYGLPDLYVSFAHHGTGHDLHKGDRVFVQFIMDERGGCLMPFGGKDAVLVRGRVDRIFLDSLDHYEKEDDPQIKPP